MDNEEIKTFIEKHKTALLIGAGILLLIVLMSPEEPAPMNNPQGGGQVPPMAGGNPGYPAGPQPTNSDSDFDMDKWREDQARDDRRQEQEIDSIREVERCVDEETGEVTEVSIHVGC